MLLSEESNIQSGSQKISIDLKNIKSKELFALENISYSTNLKKMRVKLEKLSKALTEIYKAEKAKSKEEQVDSGIFEVNRYRTNFIKDKYNALVKDVIKFSARFY